MNFLKLVSQLPDYTKITIILAILAMNCIVSFFISLHIEKVYDKTKSPEKAMNRMRLLNQYIQGGVIVISSFFVSFMSFSFFKSLGKIGKILSFSTLSLIIIIMLLATQAIYYKSMKKIRDTTESAMEQLRTTLRAILVMFLPMTIIVLILISLPNSIKEKANSSVIGILMMMLLLAAINLIMPLFYKSMLKAIPMESSELREKLDLFLKNAGLKQTSIYKWPTTKRKLANALVSGFRRKTIYISDYLIENASMDEIEAFVAHEIGHVKKHHLWIRMVLTIKTDKHSLCLWRKVYEK